MRSSRRDLDPEIALSRARVAERLPDFGLFAPPEEPPVPFEPRPVRHRQPLFGGDTYDAAKDEARLTNALRRVLACLRSGGWWTLRELAAAAQCSEAGASARLRDIRNTLHYVVHAHRRVGGLWEYALHGAPHADPPRAA